MIKMDIVVVETHAINDIPPTINLVRTLLKLGHHVKLISNRTQELDHNISIHPNLKLQEISIGHAEDAPFMKKIYSRVEQKRNVKKAVANAMKTADILWTTSEIAVRDLGKDLYKYKHVMHLMELVQYGYQYHDMFPYPIADYAKHAWKVVVAEENRAYIEKAWWGLDKMPFVFPNKPFSLEFGELSDEEISAIEELKKEKRKIIIYLGGIWEDRNLEEFSESLKDSENYRLAIVGKTFSRNGEESLKRMVEEHGALYLGAYPPPKHLAFLQYAHIGLLPYLPSNSGYLSELNALYCAPNKIFEYAGFGLPMIGTDVMGLKHPFEKYNMGCVCQVFDKFHILRQIEEIEKNYEQMRLGALQYYAVYDLDTIINSILEA